MSDKEFEEFKESIAKGVAGQISKVVDGLLRYGMNSHQILGTYLMKLAKSLLMQHLQM